MKILLLFIIRTLLSVFKLFPLRKKNIVFVSFQGTQFSCNPKYIYEYLDKTLSRYKFIWVYEKGTDLFIENTGNNLLIKVKKNTLKYFYFLLTSQLVITNNQLSTFLPKNKGSIWINTWHGGGAFKRVDLEETTVYARISKKIHINNTSYFISSSNAFSNVTHEGMGIPFDKFLNLGMPRNALLFESGGYDSIRKKLGFDADSLIVLYAPTYRGSFVDGKTVDYSEIIKCKSTLVEKYGKEVVFLARMHHSVKVQADKGFIDYSHYPDMQELLLLCDILITDYSSSIWDFSLTHKPCFLYVPDLQRYVDSRGFYSSIDTWPYPYAETIEELNDIIRNYDKLYWDNRINTYHKRLICYDNIDSCKDVCEFLIKKI